MVDKKNVVKEASVPLIEGAETKSFNIDDVLRQVPSEEEEAGAEKESSENGG